MKVRYVVPAFVFLYYMSVEYIAQVLEKLAASVWRVGVCREWYCSGYIDRGFLRATGRWERDVVQSGPFQLPNLVDRKAYFQCNCRSVLPKCSSYHPLHRPFFLRQFTNPYFPPFPIPYSIYSKMDGVPTTASLDAPPAAWIATLFVVSTLMGDFVRKIVLCSAIPYRATHSTERQQHTLLLHWATTPK